MPSATGNADSEETVRDEAVDWLLRLHAAPGDKPLRYEFDAWLSESAVNRRAYRSVERMWRLSGDLPLDYADEAGSMEQPTKIARTRSRPYDHRRAGSHACSGRRSAGRRRAGIGLAIGSLAATVVLMLLPTLQIHLKADYATGTGEIREVKLDDGSIVHLDAGSAIAVDYSPSRRDVALLSGQAFFEVAEAPARPFIVTAAGVTVSVTGTVFNVRASSDAVSIALQSGAVEVAMSGGRGSVKLAPGERVSVNRGTRSLATTRVERQDVGSWRTGRLVVDGVTLAEVIEELDRHHRGVIVLRDRALASRRVTAVLDLDRPAEALRAVVQTQRGKVTEITPFVLLVTER